MLNCYPQKTGRLSVPCQVEPTPKGEKFTSHKAPAKINNNVKIIIIITGLKEHHPRWGKHVEEAAESVQEKNLFLPYRRKDNRSLLIKAQPPAGGSKDVWI